METRLTVVERRVDDLVVLAKELRESIMSSTRSNADAIKEMTAVIHDVAAVRLDHSRHGDEILGLRRRQHELANEITRIALLSSKVDTITTDTEQLKRNYIELLSAMPNVQLASGWVFRAALFVVAGLGAVALAVVLKGGLN